MLFFLFRQDGPTDNNKGIPLHWAQQMDLQKFGTAQLLSFGLHIQKVPSTEARNKVVSLTAIAGTLLL